MNKPIKPKRPLKREEASTPIITEEKVLIYNRKNNSFLLIDAKSHPDVLRMTMER